MLDARSRLEVLEPGVAVREVGQRAVVARGVVGRQPERAGHLVGRHLALVDRRPRILLVDLHLALPGGHHRLVRGAHVLAGGALHVDDAEVRPAAGDTHAQHLGLHLDGVADVERRAEAHVDVLEVGARVLGDVLDRLAEGDQHHQAGRAQQATEAVAARVARVLRQRVRGHRELGEGGEQALGDRLAALVAEHLAEPEVLEEVPGLLAQDAGRVRHSDLRASAGRTL